MGLIRFQPFKVISITVMPASYFGATHASNRKTLTACLSFPEL